MDSLFAYVGGKSKLSGTIIEMIPDHASYIEVFSGGAWIFFRKNPSRYEVINDLDAELINFWRVIREHKEEFLRQCDYLLCAREIFDIFNKTPPCYLTDIQRAVRYFYIQRMCFGGRVANRTFGAAAGRKPRINWEKLPDRLDETCKRLRQATIERLPWDECVKRYDRPDAFFYLDPPYFKTPYYAHNLDMPDYVRIADVLAGIKGKFILSINDRPEMRECFSAFDINDVRLTYTVAVKQCTEAQELLIKNY